MRRGEVWSYVPVIERPGQSRRRLIVSADALNDTAILLAVHLVDESPDSLLAPSVGEFGWAPVITIERVLQRRLGELLGTATEDEMEQVDIALRAALGFL